MKHKRMLALFLLTVLFICLAGCKKDPVAAEREAMEEQYDVNGADPYHIRNPGGFNVWIYEKIARKVTEDGWVFSFEQYGSKTGDDSNLCRYSFSGFNLRYRYDDDYIQTVTHSTNSGVTIRERRIPAMLDWGYGSPAQQRDRELIKTILTDDREPEDLLALDPADYRFESIDGALFFGLMREALTGERHAEGTNYAYWEMQEKAFLDRTSSSASASPPTIPAAAAAGIPCSPPVWGTTTLLTFLMMLPLTSISRRSGTAPRTARALAAA